MAFSTYLTGFPSTAMLVFFVGSKADELYEKTTSVCAAIQLSTSRISIPLTDSETLRSSVGTLLV